MGYSIYTTAPDGTNRLPVHTLGPIGSLGWRKQADAGDVSAAFTVDIPINANPDALRLGRPLTIFDGIVPVWSGVLAEPQRGAPWEINAQGMASLAERYPAITSSNAATTSASTAIAAAVGFGLPWVLPTNPTAFPTPAVTNAQGQNPGTLGALLDAVAQASGMRWGVGPTRQPRMLADPAAGVFTYLLISSASPGSRTIDDFATHVYVLTASNGIVAAPTNPAVGAYLPFGRWARTVDATAVSGMTVPNAQALGNSVLSQLKPDPSFSGSIDVLPGQLTNAGGVPVRLSMVEPQTRVRFLGTQPDPISGQYAFSLSSQIVMGTWDFDAIANKGQMSPVDATPRDLQSLLTVAASS